MKLLRGKVAGKKILIGVVSLVGIFFVSSIWIKYSFHHHMAGLYLLKGTKGKTLEFSNDLFLGEEDLVISRIDFDGAYRAVTTNRSADRPRLEIKWDAVDGHGFVLNHLGEGRELVTNFSRYRDSEGEHTHGLFIGGAVPLSVRSDSENKQNDSGMTFFDGESWQHIWCNTNEGIGSTVTPKRYGPSAWEYLGSRIITKSSERLVLSSRHRVPVDGVPLQIDRTTTFAAGEPYMLLTVKITNTGQRPSQYFYYYGDEPWLGDFGGSAGDVGWTGEQIHQYETTLDPKTVSFAGMADYGSDLLGEGHRFSHVANFIEWLGPDRPDVVFFANQYDGFAHPPEVKVPLQGDARSIGMYWGPRQLAPGQSQVFSLAIGMAASDQLTGRPRKPAVRADMHAGVISPLDDAI